MQIGDVIRGPFNSLLLITHCSNSVQNEVIMVDYMNNQIRSLSFIDELKYHDCILNICKLADVI